MGKLMYVLRTRLGSLEKWTDTLYGKAPRLANPTRQHYTQTTDPRPKTIRITLLYDQFSCK